MLLKACLEIPWLAPVLWGCLYTSDYTLTLIGAQLCRNGADKHICYAGSYELTPYFQREIDRLRLVSPKFLIMLVASTLLIIVCRPLMLLPPHPFPTGYQFILGSYFLTELTVHVRHYRNIHTFIYLRRSRGVRGQICYARGLIYRSSAVEFMIFAMGYLLLFFFTGSWFFMGGSVTCLATAFKHWRLGVKAGMELPPVPAEEIAEVAYELK